MKIFTASDLNERIEILREVRTDDGYGGNTTEESSVYSRWANVYAPHSAGSVVAGAEGVTVSYEVTVRSGDVTVEYDDIIVWHDVRMRVRDYRLIQGRQFLSMECETER